MYFDQYLHKKEGQSDDIITYLVFDIAILLEGLCSGSRVHFQIWKSAQIQPENVIYKFLYIFLTFQLFSLSFFCCFYIQIWTLNTAFNIMATDNIICIFWVNFLSLSDHFAACIYIQISTLNPEHSLSNLMATFSNILIFSYFFLIFWLFFLILQLLFCVR